MKYTQEFIEELFKDKKIIDIHFDRTKNGISDYSNSKISGVVSCQFSLNGNIKTLDLSFSEHSHLEEVYKIY